MRKPSREQLEADLLRTKIENTVLSRALNAVLNNDTELPVSFFAKDIQPDEPGRYTFRFFDPDSPSGERVIVTYSLAGQKDHSAVYDLDSQRAWAQQNPGAVWSRIFYHALANRRRREGA